MTKIAPSTATAQPTFGAATSGLIAHTYVRMRGQQSGNIAVYNARTPHARVTMTIDTVLMTFWSAAAAQGVLEGISAAKHTLLHVPTAVPIPQDPYGRPTIAVDWTSRPSYAVIPQSRHVEDKRLTLHWTDVHMGPITWQILDRTAFDSLTALLRDAHRTATVVCADGHRHRADPTADDYVPALPPQQ
jgi:hypothetical protein